MKQIEQFNKLTVQYKLWNWKNKLTLIVWTLEHINANKIPISDLSFTIHEQKEAIREWRSECLENLGQISKCKHKADCNAWNSESQIPRILFYS